MNQIDLVAWLQNLVTLAGESVNQASPPVLAALFAVAALTEMGMPFPFVIDGVLFYAGYGTDHVAFRITAIMLALFLGRVAGASTIYGLSRAGGAPVLRWLERRAPKAFSYLDGVRKRLGVGASVGVTAARVGALVPRMMALARLGFRVPGEVAVARLTPGLLTAVSVASGMIRLGYPNFVAGILLASLAADGALILSGVLASLGIQFLGVTPSPWVFAIGLVLIMVLSWAIPRYAVHRKPRKPASDVESSRQ